VPARSVTNTVASLDISRTAATPASSAEPPTSTAPQEQTAPPPDSSPRMNDTDKQTLLQDCIRQVQAANTRLPEKDIKGYCDKQVKSYSPQ